MHYPGMNTSPPSLSQDALPSFHSVQAEVSPVATDSRTEEHVSVEAVFIHFAGSIGGGADPDLWTSQLDLQVLGQVTVTNH